MKTIYAILYEDETSSGILSPFYSWKDAINAINQYKKEDEESGEHCRYSIHPIDIKEKDE